MTVPTTAAFTGPYYANGVTTQFPFGFKINDASEVSFFYIGDNGAEVVISPADYTVQISSNPNQPGGTLTTAVPPAANPRPYYVALDADFTQNIKFEDEGAFNQSILNPALDEGAQRSIWLLARLKRALLAPFGETGFTLLPAALRANLFPYFGPTGALIYSSGTGGGDAALRGDLGNPAIGGALIAMDDGRTLDDSFARLRGPYPAGAAADGFVNDKIAIDTVNLSGSVVDLMGATYAYTGDVDLTKARFVNGVIVSSTMGTLDFRSTLIFDNRIITVGAAGTIKKLRHLMAYLRHISVLGKLEVQILEKNTPNDATGSMALDVNDFYHPDMERIYFVGGALSGGGVPAATELPGRNMASLVDARAADRPFILARFAASIYFTGTDDLNGLDGLSATSGFSATRIFFENHSRYNLAVNWNNSHASKTNQGGRVMLADCAIDGGVWGTTLFTPHVYFGGARVLLSTPLNGGGFFAEDCTFYKDGVTELHIYHPKCTPNSNLPKYGFSATRCRFLFEPDGLNANKVFMQGPFLHGVYLIDCTGAIPDVSYDGVTQPRTQVGGDMEYGRPKARAADPAKTALTQGALQPGTLGNALSGNLFHVSCQGVARYRGVDVADCICESYFSEDSGGINVCGLNAKEDITTSKATAKAYRAFASCGSVHRPNVTAPQGGSVDGFQVILGARVHLYDNTGISPDITVNTEVKGNYIGTP